MRDTLLNSIVLHKMNPMTQSTNNTEYGSGCDSEENSLFNFFLPKSGGGVVNGSLLIEGNQSQLVLVMVQHNSTQSVLIL